VEPRLPRGPVKVDAVDGDGRVLEQRAALLERCAERDGIFALRAMKPLREFGVLFFLETNVVVPADHDHVLEARLLFLEPRADFQNLLPAANVGQVARVDQDVAAGDPVRHSSVARMRVAHADDPQHFLVPVPPRHMGDIGLFEREVHGSHRVRRRGVGGELPQFFQHFPLVQKLKKKKKKNKKKKKTKKKKKKKKK
jgi:hypothetical protein